MSIDNLIDSPDGIKAAIEIENSLTRKKTELLRKIFDKVIDRSKAEFGSDFDMDFNNPIILEENINEYYSRKKSSSTYPSVTINHGMIDSSVDGTEYFFVSRFEIEWRAYAAFGIMMCKNDVISMVDKPTKALIEKVKNRVLSPEIIEFKKGWWLYWEYVVANGQDPGTSEPDFRLMNDAYLELFDESHQDSFVEKVISTLNKLKGCVK